MKHRQVWLFEEGRDLFKVIRTYWPLNSKCFSWAKMRIKKTLLIRCRPVPPRHFPGMECRRTVALARSQHDSCPQTIRRPDARVRAGSPSLAGFPDEVRKTILLREASRRHGEQVSSPNVRIVGQWETHVDSPAHSVKRASNRRSDRSERNGAAWFVIRCAREAAKDPDYAPSARAGRKMGKRSRTNPRRCVCCDADRLVEALARCGKDGKQRCQWHRALPGWSLPA